MRLRGPRCLVTLALAAAVGAAAQDRPQFSADAELVVLHVSVKDRSGRHVTGLTRDAFQVVEDGRTEEVRFFLHEDAPATVGLLVDNSGSMWANQERVLAAASAFAEASSRRDELFAMAFDDNVVPALPAEAPFTGDPVTFRRALGAVVRPRGRTSLFDAVLAGLDYVARGRHARKALVVVSDGRDNASRSTFDEVARQAHASNAAIYTVALVDAVEYDRHPDVLKQLARATGGEAFAPRSMAQIGAVLEGIAADIRHAYTLGYVSSNTARNGAFRRVRVVVTPPGRAHLIVRTRDGYLAGLPRRP